MYSQIYMSDLKEKPKSLFEYVLCSHEKGFDPMGHFMITVTDIETRAATNDYFDSRLITDYLF